MNTVDAILDGARISHKLPILKIVETGCEDTYEIGKWCSKNSACTFETADLDSNAQELAHDALEKASAAKFYTYRTKDHKKFLSDLTWIDVAFLKPDDLQNGLEEFHLALSAGARIVVIRNFQSKAAIAVRQAQRLGWGFETAGDYSILIRMQG